MIWNEKTKELLRKVSKIGPARRVGVRQSHQFFFWCYFGEYMKYGPAPFQNEMFSLTEKGYEHLLAIVAFRCSAKSTIITMSYPIWAILGRKKKKFVLILSRTQRQARQLLINIRTELERNQLLRSDLGPFKEETDEWNAGSLVFSNYGARISAASMEQSIRGMRHGSNRPDLIICDDIEDLDSVMTQESRDHAFRWFTGEVLPIGDRSSDYVLVGNMLHEDSVLMRLKKEIESRNRKGIYREYPLLDLDGNIAWPDKYPTLESLEEERMRIGNEVAWQREFLLKIVPDDDQIIRSGWIQFHDGVPEAYPGQARRYVAIGVDPAISKNPTADCTAVVSAVVCGYKESLRVYILPNPVNERLTMYESVERIAGVADTLGNKSEVKIFIENVAFQDALVQALKRDNYKAEGVATGKMDKRERLSIAAGPVEAGKVFFPKRGAELLIGQLVRFGYEKHDDLADAFSTLMRKVIDNDKGSGRIGLATGDMHIAKIVEQVEEQDAHGRPYDVIGAHRDYLEAWKKIPQNLDRPYPGA